MISLKVYINDMEATIASVISAHDTDEIKLVVTPPESGFLEDDPIDLFFEDYKIPLHLDAEGCLTTESINLFRESFGYSTIRLFVDNSLHKEHVFNITTSRQKFESIKGMVSYLVKNNSQMLDICFSKTKYKSRNDGEATATFDTFITQAEKIVALFDGRSSALPQELHSKFITTKELPNPLNYYDIDPYDVIENLQDFQQGYSDNFIKVGGRMFSLDNMPRRSSGQSYDTEENRVLLAGMMSIKQVLLDIESKIEHEAGKLVNEGESSSVRYTRHSRGFAIEDLYAQLTTDGMLKRISSVLEPLEDLLYIMRRRLGVEFHGFLPPKMTSVTRRSSLYFEAYKMLGEWYRLGRPVIGVNDDLTKIRSTSRIYEFFTLYKLIEVLFKRDWSVVDATQHAFFGSFIPSKIRMKKEGVVLDIDYEKRLYGYSDRTQDKELIAISKTGSEEFYNYYTPDFLVTRDKKGSVDYFVLDAKYSSTSTLNRFSVLDSLYDKYYSNLAVYNKDKNTLEKGSILAVNAIHPFGRGKMSKWPEQAVRVIPDVSTVLLSNDYNNLYDLVDQIEL